MDKRLETYLQGVAHELRRLEPEQREAELREMQQHLEAITARLVEGGASEEEATEAAIAQFGAACAVGRELDTAGAGRERWWRILLAPVCGWVCLNTLYYPYQAAIDYLMLTLVNPSTIRTVMVVAVVSLAPLASGAVAGCLSPRWGGGLLLGLKSLKSLLLVARAVAVFPSDVLWRSVLVWLLIEGAAILVGSYLGSRLARRLQSKPLRNC